MRLFKREGSNYWWCDFVIAGERHRFTTKRESKAEATAVVNAYYKRTLDRVQLGVKPEITVSQAFDRIIESVEATATKNSYRLCRDRWCGPYVDKSGKVIWSLPPGLTLSKLTQAHIEDHRINRKREGLTNNSINVEIRALQRAYNYAKRRFMAAPDIEFEKAEKFVKTRFLSGVEINLIMTKLEGESAPNKRAQQLFVFLLDTGLRLNEALSLGWASVDDHNRQIEIYREKTRSMSLVPLTSRAESILNTNKQQENPFESMDRAVKLLRQAIHEVCNGNPKINAQRGKATIHSIRDTYASRLVRSGMSLHQLAKLLGHTSAAMSAKYAHLESGDVAHLARTILEPKEEMTQKSPQ